MATPGVPEETRFAVVMYGGVSLAVYMNGIAEELYHLVRATAPRNGDRTSAELHVPDERLASSEHAYRRLAKGRGRQDEPGVRRRFVVDILAGTSAGGINAVYLAKALAMDEPFGDLADVWEKEADLERLLNDAGSAERGVPPPRDPRALLNGQRMYVKLLEALRAMEEKRAGAGSARSPYVDDLDLAVTATDLAGTRLPLQLADGKVAESRHRAVFRFQVRGADRSDFDGDACPWLALAARCTSSFPVAFEPVALSDLAGKIPSKDLEALRDRGRWLRHLGDTGTGEGGGTASLEDVRFADGGYLDNKPFGHALDAIERRLPAGPCDRKLVYIEPAPEHAPDGAQRDFRSPVQNLIAALTLPMKETIRDDVHRLLARNRILERYRHVAAGLDPYVAIRPGREGAPGRPARIRVEKDAWLSSGVAEMVRAYGPAYVGYHRLKVGAVTDDLTAWFASAAGLGPDGDLREALRMAVLAWRELVYPETPPPGPARAGTSADTEFLLRFDLAFRLRRSQFMFEQIARLSDPALRDGVLRDIGTGELATGAGRGAEVEAFDAQLARAEASIASAHEILRGALRALSDDDGASPLRPWAEQLKTPSGERGRSFRAQLAGILDHPRDEARRADLDRLLGTYRADFTAAARAVSEFLEKPLRDAAALLESAVAAPARPAPGVAGGPEAPATSEPRGAALARAALAHFHDRFEDYDLVLLPLLVGLGAGEAASIDLHRISPEDTTRVMPAPTAERKLFGARLAHFGAFLDPRWRAHDMLWGRLDGAERLVDILLGTGPGDGWREELLDDAHRRIVEEWVARHGREGIEAVVEAELRNGPAAGRWDARSRAARIASLLSTSVAPAPTRPAAVLDALRSADASREEVDRERVLHAAARGSVVVGRMLERETSESGRLRRPSAAFLRVARVFWAIAEIAVPRSLVGVIARHGRALLALAALLVLVLGILFSQPLAAAGALALLLLGLVGVGVGLVRDYVDRRWRWGAGVAAVLVVALIALATIGAFAVRDELAARYARGELPTVVQWIFPPHHPPAGPPGGGVDAAHRPGTALPWLASLNALLLGVGVAFVLLGRRLGRVIGLVLLAGGTAAHVTLVKDLRIEKPFDIERLVGDPKFTMTVQAVIPPGAEHLGSFEGFRLGDASVEAIEGTDARATLQEVCRRWLDRRRHNDGVLLVVGSADRLPLRRDLRKRYEANVGLARARAQAVLQRLLECAPRDPATAVDPKRAIVLVSGPAYTPAPAPPTPLARAGDLGHDRRVDVWALWSSPVSAPPPDGKTASR